MRYIYIDFFLLCNILFSPSWNNIFIKYLNLNVIKYTTLYTNIKFFHIILLTYIFIIKTCYLIIKIIKNIYFLNFLNVNFDFSIYVINKVSFEYKKYFTKHWKNKYSDLLTKHTSSLSTYFNRNSLYAQGSNYNRRYTHIDD